MGVWWVAHGSAGMFVPGSPVNYAGELGCLPGDLAATSCDLCLSTSLTSCNFYDAARILFECRQWETTTTLMRNLQLQFSLDNTNSLTICLWSALHLLRLDIYRPVLWGFHHWGREYCPCLPGSTVITTSKGSSVIWVRKRKTQVSSTPSGTSIKLWFISIQTECTRTKGHVFMPGFFIFLPRRERVAGVAMGWQIKWSNGSCLGRSVQTAARQAEWAVECLSSCRVHGTQWKATHLVTGLLGRGVPTLALPNRHNRLTKAEVVRKLYSRSEKKRRWKAKARCGFTCTSCLVSLGKRTPGEAEAVHTSSTKKAELKAINITFISGYWRNVDLLLVKYTGLWVGSAFVHHELSC